MRDPNSIPDRGDPDRDPTIVHSNSRNRNRKDSRGWRRLPAHPARKR